MVPLPPNGAPAANQEHVLPIFSKNFFPRQTRSLTLGHRSGGGTSPVSVKN
jgi:hypothetical protein